MTGSEIREKFLEEKFPAVTSSPPYYKKDEGPVSPNSDKAGVRFEMNGTIFDYFKSASYHLESGGFYLPRLFTLPPNRKLVRKPEKVSHAKSRYSNIDF